MSCEAYRLLSLRPTMRHARACLTMNRHLDLERIETMSMEMGSTCTWIICYFGHRNQIKNMITFLINENPRFCLKISGLWTRFKWNGESVSLGPRAHICVTRRRRVTFFFFKKLHHQLLSQTIKRQSNYGIYERGSYNDGDYYPIILITLSCLQILQKAICMKS